MSLCLLEEGGMEALHSSDCLQRLLKCIQESQVPQMKINAVSFSVLLCRLKLVHAHPISLQTIALSRAASDLMSLKILHEQDAEKVFIGLLSSSVSHMTIA